jgi:hypothetical protein
MDTLYSFKPRYDVVIIGARCAGAATALLLMLWTAPSPGT